MPQNAFLRSSRVFLTVLICALMVLSATFIAQNSGKDVSKAGIKSPIDTRATHVIITIGSDAALASQATSEGWTGTGTSANPYLIQNYTIDGGRQGWCINLSNTQKYVTIKNCELFNVTAGSGTPNSWAGLILRSVSNVRLENVTSRNNGGYAGLTNNAYGMRINNSANIEIVKCNFINNWARGGNASGANAGHAYAYGIYLKSCTKVNLTDTICQNNTGTGGFGATGFSAGIGNGYGISIDSCSKVSIVDVTCRNNTGQGGTFAGANTGNGANGLGFGLYAQFSNNVTAEKLKTLWNNARGGNGVPPGGLSANGGTANTYGVVAIVCTDMDFGNCSSSYNNATGGSGAGTMGNGGSGSTYGMAFGSCLRVKLRYPQLIRNQAIGGGGGMMIGATGNGIGLTLATTHRSSVNGALVQGNRGYPGGMGGGIATGILFSSSNNNTLTNSTVSEQYSSGMMGATTYSVYILNSNNDTISDCNISGNTAATAGGGACFGFYASGSKDLVVKRNLIAMNNPGLGMSRGVSLDQTHRSQISNNTIMKNGLNSGNGIYLATANGNTIIYNAIVEHPNEGIYISGGTGNLLHHNSLVRNNNGAPQGYDAGTNQWDDGSRGNYWSNYFARYPGATHNGYVWNTPYAMNGAGGDKDRYPLVRGFFGPSMRNPIRINSNSDFTLTNGVSNPSAAGTSTDPYIIENWAVSGAKYGCGIYIGNTTKYFEVRNCSLNGSTGNPNIFYLNTGILLFNTQNGTLNNVTAYDNGQGTTMFVGAGITLQASNRTKVTDCDGHNNLFGGILGLLSGNLTVANSRFDKNGAGSTNTFGMVFFWCNNASVDRCVAKKNSGSSSGYGFAAVESKYLKVTNSSFDKNGGIGDAGIGMIFSDSRLAILDNVSCSANGGMDAGIGIFLINSQDIYAVNCTSTWNNGSMAMGIYVMDSQWNTFDHCNISSNMPANNSIGVGMEGAQNNTFSKCFISNNIGPMDSVGMTMTAASNFNQVLDSNISMHGRGIYMTDAHNNLVKDDVFYTDNYGFYLYQSDNNRILNNTLLHTGINFGSCPYLYTYNGKQMEFIADVNGMGGVGYKYNISVHGGPSKVLRAPTAMDYTAIDASQLRARAGSYELELVEEQDEITYFDGAELWVIDHPSGVEVYNSEAALCTVAKDLLSPVIHTVKDPKPVVSATDRNGNDILSVISEKDGVYTDAQSMTDNYITIDLGNMSSASQIKLVYTAYTDWAPLAVVKANVYAEVINSQGKWEIVSSDEHLGKPEAIPRTYVMNITDWFKTNDYRLRLHTGNILIYVDQILVDTSADEAVTVTKLAPTSASLYFKGPEHPGFEYFFGDFTRYGDVLPLMTSGDDEFVIMRDGDAVKLKFPQQPAPAEDRDYWFVSDAFFKQPFVKYTLRSDRSMVNPLPFHSMSNYPYAATEHYPSDAGHQAYQATYNTRSYNQDPRYGMSLPQSNNNTVTGNTIMGLSGTIGLALETETNATVTNNTIIDYWKGIIAFGSEDILIAGNHIQNIQESGIELNSNSRVQISENDIKMSDRYGIVVNTNDNLSLENNSVSDATQGIIVMDGRDVEVLSNDIFHTELGIYLADIERASVKDNEMANATGGGLAIERCSQTMVDSNKVYGYQPLSDASLRADWSMDEASWTGASGEVADSSGNGNAGTSVGGPITTPGFLGKAGAFNASKDYVKCGAGATLDLPGTFTIMAWVYVNGFTGYQAIVAKAGDLTLKNLSYALSIDPSGCVNLLVSNGTKMDNISFGGSPLPTGRWNFVCVAASGTNYLCNVNGNDNVQPQTVAPQDVPYNLTIGINDDRTLARQFNGSIDDIRLFARAMTMNELTGEMFNAYSGISLMSCNDTMLKGNKVNDTLVGIRLMDTGNATVYNNYFKVSYEYQLTGIDNITWNIAKTPGMNILGGNYLGGNYWAGYTGEDLNGDWLGDTLVPYGPGDQLPLVHEKVPPTIADATTGTPTTGENFTLKANASDVGGQVFVNVEYYFGTGPHNNASMNVVGPGFEWEISVAHSLAPLYYHFSVRDVAANWNATPQYTKAIVDNDMPWMLNKSVPTSARIGEDIPVTFECADNIAIGSVKVAYTCTNGTKINSTMTLAAGKYSFAIPGQWVLGNLALRFYFADTYGNLNWSTAYTVAIFDDAKPVVSIATPANGTLLSGTVEINTTATDAHSGVAWALLTVIGASTSTLKNATANFTAMLTDWDTTLFADGTWTITITACDLAGNRNTTSIQVIVDNTPPTVDAGADVTIFEGETVNFNASGCSDASGIASYDWTFADSGNNLTLLGMAANHKFDNAGNYTVTLTVSDVLGHQNTDIMVVHVVKRPVVLERPHVISTSPADGAKNISVAVDVLITFSLPMNTSSVTAHLSVSPSAAYNATWEVGNTVLRINFLSNLSYNTTYTLSLSNATASIGTYLLDAPFSFSFTTAKAPVIVIDDDVDDDVDDDTDDDDTGGLSGLAIALIVIGILLLIIIVVVIIVLVMRRKGKEEEKPEEEEKDEEKADEKKDEEKKEKAKEEKDGKKDADKEEVAPAETDEATSSGDEETTVTDDGTGKEDAEDEMLPPPPVAESGSEEAADEDEIELDDWDTDEEKPADKKAEEGPKDEKADEEASDEDEFVAEEDEEEKEDAPDEEEVEVEEKKTPPPPKKKDKALADWDVD